MSTTAEKRELAEAQAMRAEERRRQCRRAHALLAEGLERVTIAQRLGVGEKRLKALLREAP